MTRTGMALAAAAATSGALLGGALLFQYVGGLYPCEMCHWQRWPHIASLVFAAGGAFALTRGRTDWGRSAAMLAGLALFATAAIGIFHVGVEQNWWEGPTECAVIGGNAGSVEDIMADVLGAPVVRCDQIAWSFAGISMAGYNALISFVMGGLVLWLSRTRKN